MCVCVSVSLTGDRPSVRSCRQGLVCVCVSVSLTGDWPSVRSCRQGLVCVCVCVSDRRPAICAVL